MVKLFMRRRENGTVCYEVNTWYRAAFAAFALVLIGGSYLSRDQVPFSWISFPMVASYFLLFAALYYEYWKFDPHAREIIHRYGVLWFTKREVYPFDEFSAVQLRLHRKGGISAAQTRGGARRAHLTLSLIRPEEAQPVEIESISRRRSAGGTEAAAEAVAACCGLPLEQISEFDEQQH